jgi:hypothetical protein
VIDPGNIIFKQTTIKGFWGTKRAERTSPADTRRMIVDLIRLATQGGLPLRVAGKFSLADVAEAAAASETPGERARSSCAPPEPGGRSLANRLERFLCQQMGLEPNVSEGRLNADGAGAGPQGARQAR